MKEPKEGGVVSVLRPELMALADTLQAHLEINNFTGYVLVGTGYDGVPFGELPPEGQDVQGVAACLWLIVIKPLPPDVMLPKEFPGLIPDDLTVHVYDQGQR